MDTNNKKQHKHLHKTINNPLQTNKKQIQPKTLTRPYKNLQQLLKNSLNKTKKNIK